MVMIPGKVVGISVRGHRTYEIHGLRNESDPMKRDTSFDVGSVTKIISTTSILMKMASNKRINLQSKVAEFLPSWRNLDKSDVTIEDLLTHHSGLNEWKPIYINHDTRDNAHEDIAVANLKYPRGSARHYSDLGFMTLGRIIEVIAGESLDLVFAREIAQPLSLTQTQYASPKDKLNVAATSWGDRIEREMVDTGVPYPVSVTSGQFSRWRDYRLVGEVNDGNAFHLFNGISGHAGLFATVDDFLTYGEALMKSKDFFDPALVDLFTQPGRDAMQGMGFRNWKSGQYVGHTGFPGVALAIDLKAERVVALMTNRLVVDGALTPTDQLLSEYLI